MLALMHSALATPLLYRIVAEDVSGDEEKDEKDDDLDGKGSVL